MFVTELTLAVVDREEVHNLQFCLGAFCLEREICSDGFESMGLLWDSTGGGGDVCRGSGEFN